MHAESPRLIDVVEPLSNELGQLLPWIEPALKFYLSEHFDVAARERTLGYVPGEFLDRFEGNHVTLGLDAIDAQTESDVYFARAVMFKAVELRARAAAPRAAK